MKPFSILTLACAAAGFAGGCVHTPPGTSVEIALARKAELIRLPPAAEPKLAGTGKPGTSGTPMPYLEPELPLMDDRLEAGADAFTRGKFAMADGDDQEAIAAFEEVVRLEPTNQEAWQNLAILYEKVGAGKKAIDAFRRSKSMAGR